MQSLERNQLSKLIEESQKNIKDVPRNYIGASSIGSDCLRQIWYEYKGYPKIGVPSKTRRTWDIGKHLESLVLYWLETSGVSIEREWIGLHSVKVPEFHGHIDAALIKDTFIHSILEIKTAKDSSFKEFVNNGLREWNAQYYAQVQSYMGMSGINSATILVLNKDSSELADETVVFDKEFYEQLEIKALQIANSTVAPPRISNSPIWYRCKICSFRKVCHE